MNPRTLAIERLTKSSFAPFGDVIEAEGGVGVFINQGYATRYDGQTCVDAETAGGGVNVSLFVAQPRATPIQITSMERHPLGSQLFAPMQDRPWLVVVCAEPQDPSTYRAFCASGRQAVNYRRNVWHHALLSLDPDSLYLVIDRRGPGDNLEEAQLDETHSLRLDPHDWRSSGF